MTIKRQPELKMRHELKHRISHADDLLVTSLLRKLFRHDDNADSRGSYRVSSLYFDTPTDRALREKIDGVDRREKFRIRCYGDAPTFARLEKKVKINGLCAKRSARLTLEETRRILAGDVDFLAVSDNALLVEFYSKLRGGLEPKTVVTYDREAFVYEPGNVRVTLDRNLRSGLGSVDFLDPELFHLGVSDGFTVLEVKYDEFLPEIVQRAVQLPRRAAAYSKYAVCRRFD